MLIFCLVVLFIIKEWILQSPIFIIEFSLILFLSQHIFFALFFLTFNLFITLNLKYVSGRWHLLALVYFIQSDNLYLLIGLFITFIFNAVMDIIGLMSAILFLVFSVSQVFFSFPSVP